MKSPEYFAPSLEEQKEVGIKTTPKSPEVRIVEISNEQLEQYVTFAKSCIEQQATAISSGGRERIMSSAENMNISPETLNITEQEFELSGQLRGVQIEADKLANIATSKIAAVSTSPRLEANLSPDIVKSELTKSPDKKKTVLGFQRNDLSGFMQKARGKENIRYVGPEGQEFFTKYVNQQEGMRDNIAGLKNEKHFLDLLADSGVTPKTSELKIYPNEKRARLSIEQVSGISLDKMDKDQSTEFLKKNAEATIYSTAEALDKVHQKDILLVDVNEGTFLIDKKDGNVSTHLVDFELAVDLSKNIPEDRDSAFRWYASKDLGLSMDENIDHQDTGVLKKAELNLWARTLVMRMIGLNNVLATVKLPPEKQKTFDAIKVKISPILEKKIIERAKKDYQYQSQTPKENRLYELPTEDDFIQKELKSELPRKIEEGLLGITLEEKMIANGIALSEGTLDFMSQALNPELEKRPTDFREYLDKNRKQ